MKRQPWNRYRCRSGVLYVVFILRAANLRGKMMYALPLDNDSNDPSKTCRDAAISARKNTSDTILDHQYSRDTFPKKQRRQNNKTTTWKKKTGHSIILSRCDLIWSYISDDIVHEAPNTWKCGTFFCCFADEFRVLTHQKPPEKQKHLCWDLAHEHISTKHLNDWSRLHTWNM